MLDQAEGYRVRQKTPDLKPGAETSTRRTSKTVENDVPPSLRRKSMKIPKANLLLRIYRQLEKDLWLTKPFGGN